jgi:hypothetical protein
MVSHRENHRISQRKCDKNRHEAKRGYEQKRRDEGKYKKWYQNNPDKMKNYQLNHKHKTHKISEKEWLFCKEYFNNSCAYCGLSIENHFKKYNNKIIKIDLHKEHVDNNGANDISNCIPSCLRCNSMKWKHDLSYWYNDKNINYTNERINKIKQWINKDYKLIFIKDDEI